MQKQLICDTHGVRTIQPVPTAESCAYYVPVG